MNDYEPSKPDTSGGEEKGRGLPLPSYARAAIYGVVWLPFLGLIAFLVPQFEELFNRLQESGELPAVTAWLLWFTSLNEALFYFPCLLVLVLLVVSDVGIAGLLRHSRREWLYWGWFVGVVAMGILAAAVIPIALVLPILKMSQSL